MIFVAGHHDTGKSTLAKFLVERGFVHVETGDVVRQLYRDSGSELIFTDWARQNGHNFDGQIIKRVSSAKEIALLESKQDVVVTGNRQIEGIQRICDGVEPLPGRKNTIVYTEAMPEVLYTRHQLRPDRRIEGLTFDDFKRDILAYDKEMGVEQIRDHADLIICNNCGPQNMYNCFSARLRELGYTFGPTLEGHNHCPMRRI